MSNKNAATSDRLAAERDYSMLGPPPLGLDTEFEAIT
jgi:hypothetical protein